MALLAAAALAALGGCGGSGASTGASTTTTGASTTATGASTTTAGATTAAGGGSSGGKDSGPAPTLAPSHCPPGHPACRTTEGRIVYVERVDPDGDGDAHFVVIDPHSITLPGLTAIDVRVGLRPHPLPGIGDRVSAAGPVQTGSYGQHQIHALEVHVAE